MKSWSLRISCALGLLAGSFAAAQAHPGHGASEPGTLTHELLEPLHAAPVVILLAGVAIALAARLLWKRKPAAPRRNLK